MKMKTKHGIRVWKESEGWGYTIQYKRTLLGDPFAEFWLGWIKVIIW